MLEVLLFGTIYISIPVYRVNPPPSLVQRDTLDVQAYLSARVVRVRTYLRYLEEVLVLQGVSVVRRSPSRGPVGARKA